ncbi:hypothetical protein [Actinomadura flavalba]|uniref:hypothetical protein n=1 Tax=Actinomadura flavalba TaxID=1120938 RepID=UPI0003626E11|nr:hypothetical protein [Actinomadura flavalba]
MRHPRPTAATLAASAAVLAAASLATAAPSAAAPPTVIRVGNAAGAAYSGNIRMNLTTPVSVSTSLGTASCNRGRIDASVASSGANLTVSVYTFYNDPGPACTNSAGGSSSTSPVGLPWTGGDINWTGSSGTVRINNMQVTSTSSTFLGNIVCNYRGTGPGNSITMSVTNSTASTQLKATASGVSLAKVNAGSNVLCPSTATYSAGFDVFGQSAGGYDVKLFLS